MKWPIPSSREELNGFLWLTPFLRIFISGRAQLVIDMKKAYLTQVADELKSQIAHDAEVEECDQDLTKETKKPKAKNLSSAESG